MEKIEIVCKYNEVRSPFLSSFFRLQIPKSVFSSSGVLPLQNHFYNSSAMDIAKEWGFEYKKDPVSATSNNGQEQKFLPVDDWVRSRLRQLVEPDQILSLMDGDSLSDELMPIDPINCNRIEMRFELAKLLCYGVLQVQNLFGDLFPANVSCLIPRNSASEQKIFTELIRRRASEEIVIVDASLKVSRRVYFQDQGLSLHIPLERAMPGSIYSTIFEFPESEKLLCSVEWREWIKSLSTVGKVVIVTPPMGDSSHGPICDAFLAAIWAAVKEIF